MMKIPSSSNETFSTMFLTERRTNSTPFDLETMSTIRTIIKMISFKSWFDVKKILKTILEPEHAICMHVYVFLSCMIGLTLFFGVAIVKSFMTFRDKIFLTFNQKLWYDLKRRLKLVTPLNMPHRSNNKIRAFAYDIARNPHFRRIVAISVFADSGILAIMCSNFCPHVDLLATILTIAMLLSVLDVLLKNVAATPCTYLINHYNRCDLIDTLGGCIWLIMYFTLRDAFTYFVGCMVLVFRLLSKIAKRNTCIKVVGIVSLSAFKSLMVFGILLLEFYSIPGNISEDSRIWTNFTSPGESMLMLYRIAQCEGKMNYCSLEPSFCTPSFIYWDTRCGSYTASLAYFCTFYIIITYIVLSLLRAIIKENVSLFYVNDCDVPILSNIDIENFRNAWNIVDVYTENVLSIQKIKFVLRLLKGRLNFKEPEGTLLFKHMCYELQLLHNGKKVTFHEVLNMLAYRTIMIEKSLQLKELIERQTLETQIEREVATQTIRKWLIGCLQNIRNKCYNNVIDNAEFKLSKPPTETAPQSIIDVKPT